MASVLAAGRCAVLSHRSAAALWRVRIAYTGAVEVTVPRALRSRSALRVHRSKLAADEVSTVDGIPVTTPSRTLLDLAAVVRPRQLERAVDEAEVLRLADTLSLAELLARHPGRPGVAALRRLVDAGRIGSTITRSELENRFGDLIADAKLPRPEVNAQLELVAVDGGWIEADFVWRVQRLVAELDGFASHGTRTAFERDRARDRRLQAAGWRVVRVTWRHLHDDPVALVPELRGLLGTRVPC